MKNCQGVVTGIVESGPDSEGRVQISYPWLKGMREYPQAPVATPLAGRKRGMFVMPEKGDEVVVGFDKGDFNHPIILGFLWNGAQKPPESDPKIRVILTPGGHTLRFEDGENAKKIILRSNAGHEITLDDAGTTVVVRLKGGGSINMTQNSLELQHGHKITITSQGIALA